MKPLPTLDYTKDAHRDFKRCRQFLRRQSPRSASRRRREMMNAVRRVRANPEINPVRKVDPVTGLHLRRHNVAQFVIVYVYFKPDASEPNGVVSIRAVRHAGEEDVLWEIRECGTADATNPARSFLSTRSRASSAGYRPLSIYGEVRFFE